MSFHYEVFQTRESSATNKQYLNRSLGWVTNDLIDVHLILHDAKFCPILEQKSFPQIPGYRIRLYLKVNQVQPVLIFVQIRPQPFKDAIKWMIT